MRRMVAIAVLGLLLAAGCEDDTGEDTTSASAGGQATAGGEDTGGGTAEGIEQPPGSVQPKPGEQGAGQGGGGGELGDEGGSSGGSGSGGGSGGGDGSGGEKAPSADARWGKSRQEQCKQASRPQIGGSARSSLQRGLRAARDGNLRAAQQAFQKAVDADRNAYPALYNLGVIAARRGDESQALEYYRRALRVQADYEKAAQGMVSVYLRRGSVPEALAFIEPLAKKHRANKALQAVYAEVLVHAERYDDAWDAARTALRCDERFVPAMTALIKASLAQGRTELAESIMEQALKIDQRNAELHFVQGKMLLDEPGRLRDAMDHLKKSVKLEPDHLEARMLLGEQLLSGANYTGALEHFEAAAKLAPDLLAVHLNLADAYRATEQWDKAKSEFGKVLSMKPDLPEAHFNMGLMYMQAGGEFPGLDNLQAMEKAVDKFKKYRDVSGPRLARDDPSEAYMTDLQRQIEREKRRREREKERAARQADGG